MRALIVEPDAGEALRIREVLERFGHSAAHLPGAEEAWAAFQREEPVLVLIRWNAGHLATAFIERVRRERSDTDVVIIGLTDRTEHPVLRAIIDSGADDYLVTPLSEGELQARLTLAERRVRELAQRRMLRQHSDDLRAQEMRYRDVFDEAREAIYLTASDGRISEANRSFLHLFGYPPEEVKRIGTRDLYVDAADCDRLEEEIRREGSLREREVLLKRSDGRVMDCLFTATVERARDGQIVGYRGMVQDVTSLKQRDHEQRRLEAQVQQAQKLESLGVLAGGIAHDFNNLLTGILGNASLALTEVAQDSPARQSVKQIEIAALRAAELTNQMLAYAGKGRFVVQRLDLSQLAKEMTQLLRSVVSKSVVLQFDFAGTLPAVEGDPGQVRQVIMNLVANASEAVGDRSGLVVLRTGAVDADTPYLKSTYLAEDVPPGLYAYVEIEDTGCGMETGTLDRIFDPFFTTKFTGRGLGLAAVLGIVRAHRGAVRVHSIPHRGTTMRVLFPATQALAEEAGPEASPEQWRGEGTILVVDDEETVRAIAKRVLERAGFRVLLAKDGREAVQVYTASAGQISAVLLDLTMPHLNGEAAFQEMRRIQPDARVVLMSGYTEPDATRRFAGTGLAGFIQKPYRPEDLLGKLRGVLSQRPI